MRLRRYCLTAMLSTFVYGCASLSTVPPEQFDLSGDWQLNTALSDSPALGSRTAAGSARSRPGGNRGAGGQNRGGARQGRKRQGREGQGRNGAKRQGAGGRGRLSDNQVTVNALQSNTIAIEQSEESMGMRFDRGVYRDVSWGERVRGNLKVITGWEERVLVIKSKGDRTRVVERYSLSDDGQRLRVSIELDGGRKDMTFLRIFDRTSPAATSPPRVK